MQNVPEKFLWGVITGYPDLSGSGNGVEWMMTQSFIVAVQDFRIGLPGMLIQLVGGYFVLKALAKA